MIGFFLITSFFILSIWGLSKLLDTQAIKSNWKKYRCRPDVMLMAKYYGHDPEENLQFCLQNGFDKRASAVISPFYTYLAQFVTILVTLLQSINSIRLTFATMIGSAKSIFESFFRRIQAFFYTIQVSSMRMKFLMDRVFSTMLSIVYMGLSGIKATTNFGNTFLFKFLDTFCFAPDTLVDIEGKGRIFVKDVCIGDIFSKTKDKVTSTFSFYADGQPMMKFPDNILVSTNHYVLYKDSWIRSEDHPDAVVSDAWNGGYENPLICFNTESNSFPVGNYIFRDYDEISEADEQTMNIVLTQLNSAFTVTKSPNYDTCCSGDTLIKQKDGSFAPASELSLGDELSFGTVVGLVKKVCSKVCTIENTDFTPGTCIWNTTTNLWTRAADLVSPVECNPTVFISVVVSPSACLETKSGIVFRDYVEIHSPDTEEVYAALLTQKKNA
jgi:hypothetical protein